MVMALEKNLGSLALLQDPVRRRIYLFVRSSRRPVGRDDVAAGAEISRKLAAFHLEKLLQEGLLVAHFAHPGGERRPGRKPKLYAPSEAPLAVSIPERRYELIGTVLADAVRSPGPGESAEDAAYSMARRRGARLGKGIRQTGSASDRPERALALARSVLEKHGFEPQISEGAIALNNCPFQALAAHAPELICGMNHAFIDGLMRGLGNQDVDVSLEPTGGGCCVQLSIKAQEADGRGE
ncbi:MAG: transcriptional regulator [Actinomycetota bacterium]|nr:transcriptional regulator [Actinomycetota bacterium]